MEGTQALRREFVVTKAYTDRLAGSMSTYMWFSPRRRTMLLMWALIIVLEVGGLLLLGRNAGSLATVAIVTIVVILIVPFVAYLRLRSVVAKQLPAGTLLWTEFGEDEMTSGRPDATSTVKYAYYGRLDAWRGFVVLSPRSAPRAVSFWPGELFPEEIRGRFGATS